MNILIAVGAIIMMLSILGCCSTTQKNRFMMILVSFLNKSQHPAFSLLKIISYLHCLPKRLAKVNETLSFLFRRFGCGS